ncbi:MAG: hypothetical protein V1799_19050 [bacterium]
MDIIKTYRLAFMMLAALLLTSGAFAQEDEYKKWLKKEQEQLQQFKDARDKEFTDFLKQQWKEFQSFKGIVPDDIPKPTKMPIFKRTKPEVRDSSTKKVEIKEIPQQRDQEEATKQPAPQPQPQPEEKKSQFTIDLTFFGVPITLPHDIATRPTLATPINEKSISDFWAALSRMSYESLLAQAQNERVNRKLNDWGYILLLNRIGRSLFNNARNEAVLFVWFMLSKSGFDTRLGYQGDFVHLLLPTPNMLYQVSYFELGGTNRYYAVQLDPSDQPFKGAIYTYGKKYPGAEKSADFCVKSAPYLKNQIKERTLKFTYGSKEYTLQTKVSRDAVDFFWEYPQTNFEIYFSATPSKEFMQSLLNQLTPLVEGKTEWDAVNMILRFVQTAFEYKTDPDQFGREKPLFPDETVYYPFSDCEDRGILFAYLVRTLLGLTVVGLDYPGHIATAVLFSTPVEGDSIIFQEKRFTICDPTYINADVGRCMPQFKGVKPEIIIIQ